MAEEAYINPNPAPISKAVEAVESIGDGVMTVDLDRNVQYLNPAAVRLTGWSAQDAIGQPVSRVFQIMNGETKATLTLPLEDVMDSDEERGLPPGALLTNKNGVELPIEDSISPIHDDTGSVTGAVISFRNASLARILLLKALHQAHHDPLTDLPNRLILEDRISQAIASLQRRPHLIGLLLLDLDNFKQINDTRGHAAGDSVLRAVARILRSAVRGSDTVCRLGGDEFVVLLPEIQDAEDLRTVSDHILGSIQKPIPIDGGPLMLTASIGAILQENDRTSVGDLLRNADAAMYAAKQTGGNRVHTLAPSAPIHAHHGKDLESELCRALEFNEFRLYYQPQVNLRTGEICGAEALLRWKRSDGELIPPLSFIPVAERSELIIPIGQWVLREATRQQSAWRQHGFSDMTISTNVSPVELRDEDYVKHLDSVFQGSALNPSCSLLEITESVLLMQSEEKSSILSAIRLRGLRLGIDDFGIGYSNLAYIRNFPIDVIKIDKSFIADCTSNQQDASLVRAMISMARTLNKGVIAEGVETQEQLAFLRDSGCFQGQGFYFSPPLPADEFTALLAKGDGLLKPMT